MFWLSVEQKVTPLSIVPIQLRPEIISSGYTFIKSPGDKFKPLSLGLLKN